MLRVENLETNYLKSISLSLKERENLLILGSNGAGKSTLARAIVGLIKSNSIYVRDKNIESLTSKQRAKYLNYTPCKLEVFDEYLTLIEYLKLSLLDDRDEKRLESSLEILGISSLKASRCKSLSSGEGQLLLIASAIVQNSKFTILDEPTANLDSKREVKLFKILSSDDYLESKIIITHNLDLAYHLGYRVLFLKDGRLEFDGDSKEFFTKSTIERFYQDSIIKRESHYVVNYKL